MPAATVRVPFLAGDGIGQAGAAIGKAGLRVGLLGEQLSTTAPKGEVVGSDPRAGTLVRSSSDVVLYISAGPGVAVPDLLGDSAAQANAALTSLGLSPNSGAMYPTTVRGFNGSVAYQRPLSGTLVSPGWTVLYRIGRPPSKS